MAKREIPNFPGIDKSKAKPPAPPKYLEITAGGSGGGSKAEIIKLDDGARGPPPLRMVNPGKVPFVPSRLASTSPTKSFDQPPHRFGMAVNSSREAKGQAQDKAITDRKEQQRLDDLIESGKGGGGPRSMPPKFIGSTYTHIVNAPQRAYVPPPKAPTLPRPYVPPSRHEFADSPLLNNRLPDGTILGSYSTRHMDPAHVPHLSSEAEAKSQMPNVGPDNPVLALNDTWSACWDDEGRAVYYYNQVTGEATWLPPNLQAEA
jgi:hypothetical protein